MPAHRTLSRFVRRLSALDSSFLYNESSNNPLHVGAALLFEGHIPFHAIVESIAQRIHLLPPFRQRLAETPFNAAHPTLEDDPQFRLENHLKRFQLSDGIDERQAMRRVLCDYRPMLNRSQPLWELLVFEGWPGGNTLLVTKVHHALADGVANVRLTKRLFDLRPCAMPPEAPAFTPTLSPLSAIQRLVGATSEMMVGQFDALSDVMVGALRDPRELLHRDRVLLEALRKMAGPAGCQIVATPWNAGHIDNACDLIWFRSPVSDYRIIRKAFGVTTNDVVLTILTEGAGRYLREHGYSTEGCFRIACPVNVRSPEEQPEFGNRVSMMFPVVPAAPIDPVERLSVVREETARVTPEELRELDRLGLRWTGAFRSDPYIGFPYGVFTSTSLDHLAPPNLAAFMARTELLGLEAASNWRRMTDWRPRPGNVVTPQFGISFVVSHVPTAQVPIYLCGRPCLDQVGILPVGGNLGYAVTVLSYNHHRYISMAAERTLMPDLEEMQRHVQAAFAELKTAAENRMAPFVSSEFATSTDLQRGSKDKLRKLRSMSTLRGFSN